jgi:hypothetical protein
MRRVNSLTALATLSAMLVGIVSPASAATEITFGSHVAKVEMKGDFRLRQDTIHDHENNSPDRSRQRYRFRLGADVDMGKGLKLKSRFATGSADQISSNQTMEDVSAQKPFSIDQMFLEYKPVESMVFRGGRMANPLWVPYSGDIVWDADFNPEGFAESFKFSLFGNGRFFVNLLQGVADEDNSATNQRDQYYISNQVGVIWPLFSDSRLTVGAALHQWVNEGLTDNLPAASATLTAPKHFSDTDGNFQTANVLNNQFNVSELTAEFLTSIWVPVSFQGTYIKNQGSLSADQLIALGVAPARARQSLDTGYQFGAIIGSAKTKGGWEAAYFRKFLEKEATVADVTDSDFGDGGTNRQGHIFWLAYAFEDYLTLGAKFFNTKRANTTIDAQDAKNRLQVDLVAKF